jgi:hypothetical protein
MTLAVITGLSFVSGLVCASLKSWKAYLPFAAVSGFAIGLIGRAMGVL